MFTHQYLKTGTTKFVLVYFIFKYLLQLDFLLFFRIVFFCHLFAGEYSGGKDTCQGDSGGPLMYRETVGGKEKMFVAGITSYGEDCALAGKPG